MALFMTAQHAAVSSRFVKRAKQRHCLVSSAKICRVHHPAVFFSFRFLDNPIPSFWDLDLEDVAEKPRRMEIFWSKHVQTVRRSFKNGRKGTCHMCDLQLGQLRPTYQVIWLVIGKISIHPHQYFLGGGYGDFPTSFDERNSGLQTKSKKEGKIRFLTDFLSFWACYEIFTCWSLLFLLAQTLAYYIIIYVGSAHLSMRLLLKLHKLRGSLEISVSDFDCKLRFTTQFIVQKSFVPLLRFLQYILIHKCWNVLSNSTCCAPHAQPY